MSSTRMRLFTCVPWLLAAGCPLDEVEHDGGCPQKVVVGDFRGTDLEVLRGTTRVGGQLVVPASATDLSALRCLQRVDGALEIRSVAALETLDGLEDLEQVHSLDLTDLPALRSTSGLSSLRHVEEYLSLSSLPSLREIEAPRDLESLGTIEVFELSALERWEVPLGATSLSQLELWRVRDGARVTAFSELESVEEYVLIEGTEVSTQGVAFRFDALASVPKLALDGIAQETVDSLGSLTDVGSIALNRYSGEDVGGLSSLRQVESLQILGAPNLRSLAGLEGLERVTALDIREAPVLEHLDALAGIREMPVIAVAASFPAPLTPGISIRNCNALTDISPLARVPTDLLSTLALTDLPALESVGEWSSLRTLGRLELSNTRVRNLDGLSGVTTLDGVVVGGDGELASTQSFSLLLSGNPQLADVDGLDPAGGAAVQQVGWWGEISIVDNASLPTCAADSLTTSLADLGRTEGPFEVAGNADVPCE